MSLILSGLVAYAGVYAGVFLGSLSAEELPFGRFRLRVLQLVISAIVIMILLYQALFNGHGGALLLALLLGAGELLGVFGKRQNIHPRDKTLVLYGVLALSLVFLSPTLWFTIAGLILLYGLITGSLIAEPYVEDRSLVPWDKPYTVAFRWTWTFPVLLVVGALIVGAW